MNYLVNGVEDKTLIYAAKEIESEISKLRSSGNPGGGFESKLNQLEKLLEKVQKGEEYGLVHAMSYLAEKIQPPATPKPGERLKYNRDQWKYDDFKDQMLTLSDEQSPYIMFHDDSLDAMSQQLENKVSKFKRDKLEANCILYILRTQYLLSKCDMYKKQIELLEQRLEEARNQRYQNDLSKVKGRMAPFRPRNDMYARVTFQLRTELNRELVSTDYPEWRKRVIGEEDGLAESTLRTAFEREASCKPTTKST